MDRTRKVNPIVTAVGEDLGNGFCVVQVNWLPAPLDLVVKRFKLEQNGKCVISAEFMDRPWNANAVYTFDFQTKYDATDLK